MYCLDSYLADLPDSADPAAPNAPVSNWKENTIEGGKVAWRLAQTLIKKVPECVTTNPVQMAFSIAKVIIKMKDVGRRLVSGALVDYYIRRLEATKTRLYVSKKPQTHS